MVKRRIAQWEERKEKKQSERKGPGLPEEDAEKHTRRDPQARSSNEPVLPIAGPADSAPEGAAASGGGPAIEDELPDLQDASESEAETVPYDEDGNRMTDRSDDDDYESADEGEDARAYLSQMEQAWSELIDESQDAEVQDVESYVERYGTQSTDAAIDPPQENVRRQRP